MTHDENTAMERSYHPTGAELWFLLSLLDDRPAPLFWPMGEPAENWPLVAVRLLDAGLAVRGENGLTPAAPLAPLLDTVKSADRAALVFLRTPGGAVDAVLYYNRVGGVLLRRESAARYTLQALDTAALLAALPPLNGAGEGALYPEFIPPADLPPLDADGTITVSGGTVLAAGGSSGMGMNLEAAQPCVIYGSTGFGGMPGSTQSSLIAADADFTIEDADGNAVYSGTARCGANFILFSSADVVADSAYTLKAGNSSTEGTAQSGTVSTGMGMGGGFPGGGQKPDGEPPESFDGQMPNGEKSELPDGEVPEMPSGERPTPPSGQGSPADGSASAGDSTSDTTPTA